MPRRGVVPDHSAIVTEQWSDRAFVADMEAALPEGAMVFQLPVLPFPEGGNIFRLVDYDLLKGYLAGTGRLRWSYGGMKGRESDWQKAWALEPVPRMVEGLAAAGFAALYVDRNGYPGAAAELDAALRPVTGAAVRESGNGRLRWYDLRPVLSRLRQCLSTAELQAVRRAVTTTPLVEPLAGMHGVETTGEGRAFRWMTSSATVRLRLPRDASRRLVKFAFTAEGPDGAHLNLQAPGASHRVRLDPEGIRVEVPLVVSRSAVTVRLTTDAPNAAPVGDQRDLRARIFDLEVRDPVVDRALPPDRLVRGARRRTAGRGEPNATWARGPGRFRGALPDGDW